MKLQIVEKLDLNEFKEPFKQRFFDWSKRQNIFDDIIKTINSNSNYKAIQKDNSIFILPNSKYLINITFNFKTFDKCDITFKNFKNDIVKLDKIILPEGNRFFTDINKNNINVKFKFDNEVINKLSSTIENLLPKVSKENILEANPKTFFKNVINKIGSKLGTTLNNISDKNKIKKDIVNNLIQQIALNGLPDALQIKLDNIDLDNDTFSLNLNRTEGTDFILGFSFEPNPDDSQQLIVKSLIDCFDNKITYNSSDRKDLQTILDVIAKKLEINNGFRLSREDQLNTGSSEDQVNTRQEEEDRANINPASETISPAVREILGLEESIKRSAKKKLFEADSSEAKTKAETLLKGKIPEGDRKGEDITLTVGDKRAILKYYFKNAVGYDNITDQALDQIAKIIEEKYDSKPLDNILINFILKYLSKNKDKQIGTKIIYTLTKNDNDLKYLLDFQKSGDQNAINAILLIPEFWDSFTQTSDIYNYLNYTVSYLIKDYKLNDKGLNTTLNLKADNSNKDTLKTNYGIEESNLINPTIANILITPEGKFRKADIVNELLSYFKDGSGNNINNKNKINAQKIAFIDLGKKLKEKTKFKWPEIDDIIAKAFDIKPEQLSSKKDEYRAWIKKLPEILYGVTLENDQITEA